MDTDYQEIKKVFDSEEFQQAKDKLVKRYSVTASSKGTLEPRDDFILKVIREYIELAVKE